jgi:hypothetical protein
MRLPQSGDRRPVEVIATISTGEEAHTRRAHVERLQDRLGQLLKDVGGLVGQCLGEITRARLPVS